MTLDSKRTTSGHVLVRTWSLFAGLLLMMLGNGLLGSLIGLRADFAGFSTVVTGIVISGYYVGFLIGAFAVPRFIERVGHVRVFAALASMASTAALIHLLIESPPVWFAMRFVTGLSFAGLYIVAESWLVDQATPETRGRILGMYMVVIMGGIALSQLLLTVADVAGVTLFVVASALVSLALVPVSLSAGPTPDFTAPEKWKIRHVWDVAPLGVVTGLLNGLANAAFLGMAVVYGSRSGMSVDRIALFVGLGIAGSVALQLPIGSFSDKFPRRRVIFTVTMLAAAAALVGSGTNPNETTMLLVVFLYGALSFPLYSLGLSHINDNIPRSGAISASVVYVFVSGVGAVLGAPMAGIAIDRWGTSAFFVFLAAVHTLLGVYAAIRIVSKDGMPVSAQRAFVMVPARTGTTIVQTVRRLVPRNGSKR